MTNYRILPFLFLFYGLVPPGISYSIYPDQEAKWADSVLNTLTLEEKIGQLIMISAYSNQDGRYEDQLQKEIQDYHIGGLCFFQGGPLRQAQLTNRLQEFNRIPMFIAMDAEWGAAMRLDSVPALPHAMTYGAVKDNSLIYQSSVIIADQLKALGAHINFGPVADVNLNPKNPVINFRSFGEDKEQVAQKAISYMKGLQDNGIISVAKHFPGHGDTETDSHQGLPILDFSKERLDSVELYVFKSLIQENIWGIMAGHLQVNVYDNRPGYPASLSPILIRQLLREKMGFKGLIFSDAMNMKAIQQYHKPGEAETLALLAGVDIVLMPDQLPATFHAIRRAVQSKKIKKSDLNEKVLRILKMKYRVGLHHYEPVDLSSINLGKNDTNIRILNQMIFERATTLLKNISDLVPFKMTDTLSCASLSLGNPGDSVFQKTLENYARFSHFSIDGNNPDPEQLNSLYNQLRPFNLIITSVHPKIPGQPYGIRKEELLLLDKLAEKSSVVIVLFGTPYSGKYFSGFKQVVCAYEDTPDSRFIVPQVLFGAVPVQGLCPVSVTGFGKAGEGVYRESLQRLGYSIPERAGFNPGTLNLIDTIIIEAIQNRATPGCQVWVAKDGYVVYNRSFGYHTYDSLQKVKESSIYDLASVTKVAGTLQAIMMLADWKMIDLDKKVSVYLPELKNTNKENIILRDLLTHQSGLPPYLPFWKNTIKTPDKREKFYSTSADAEYVQQVVPGIYLSRNMSDSIWAWITNSQLRAREDEHKPYDYKYSDIGFYLLHRLVEKLTNQPLHEYLSQNIYEPLGLRSIGYLPYNKFPVERIVPAAQDNYFRKTLIQGFVQDEMAALYGGVAGHAGLFSSANDLGLLMQMNLQKGYFGGKRYLSSATLEEFTSYQYDSNRRGLGWDKPPRTTEAHAVPSVYVSPSSYGHTGFTGTMVWIDPEYQLVYIFLSNRTYPDPENKKLIEQDVRKRIQTVIYSALQNH